MTFKFAHDEKVLFVGEGNFSFSAALVKTLKNEELCQNITSSCYETEGLESEIKIENMKCLSEHGCSVLSNVDAVKLDQDDRLKGIKFDHIIFMFPHIGGKMKIDRNKKLLLDFFR